MEAGEAVAMASGRGDGGHVADRLHRTSVGQALEAN